MLQNRMAMLVWVSVCSEVIGTMKISSELDSTEGALHEGTAENKTDSKLQSVVFLL